MTRERNWAMLSAGVIDQSVESMAPDKDAEDASAPSQKQPSPAPLRPVREVTEGWAALDGGALQAATRGSRGTAGLVCCACGGACGGGGAPGYTRRGDALFCAACWRELSADAVERVVREVALRGVPLS